MAQNRQPPAYQEYASAMMARVDYRTMSLAQRGLLYTLRLECWVNQRLPDCPAKLAKVIGYDRAEVAAAMPAVLPFFAVENGTISCPELDDYRAHIAGIRNRQSEGGRQGAAMTNAKAKQSEKSASKGFSGKSPGDSAGDSPGQFRVPSPVQPSTTQPSHEGRRLTTEVVTEVGGDDF